MPIVKKDFPADQVEAENKRLNKSKETLKAQKTELEAKLKASQDASVKGPQLEDFIREIQDKLPNLDLEGKRLALDMLGITVYLNDQGVEITGIIEPKLKLDPLFLTVLPYIFFDGQPSVGL